MSGLKKVKKPKVVMVFWDDAVHECGGDEGELEPSPLVTVAFLDKKTKKYIRVFNEYDEDSEYKRHTSAIPMKMVKKVVYLQEKKSGKLLHADDSGASVPSSSKLSVEG